MMQSLGVGKENAGKGGRGIQGRTRDYISEQVGEADLIQVWDFALTSRGCVGIIAWYGVNSSSEQRSLLELCKAPNVAESEEAAGATLRDGVRR